jgi:hypothetical protein
MIAQSCVPHEFKTARVTAIFKSGDRTNTGCYRPISVCSVFSSIIERVVCRKLTNFFEDNHILCDGQFGFRRRSSTSHAALCLVDTISQEHAQGRSTCVAFIDIKDAFPSVDHGLLVRKLEHYGIGNPLGRG